MGALGRLLAGRRLRVVTGNLPLVPVLANSPGIELIVLAGTVRPISMGVVGPLAELTLRRLTVDKAFLGADGVVAGRGLCEAEAEQRALKETDGGPGRHRDGAGQFLEDRPGQQQYWARVPGPWTLVTDAGATEDMLKPFRRMSSIRILQGANSVNKDPFRLPDA